MKYADLIQFEPIESVIQLREADEAADAKKLVETFVISERMSDMLVKLVFRQLQFDKPADNKGMLIVGNYGTGKSHLMALVSAIAEHTDLADAVNDQSVADKAAPIAGRFKVIRAEIGASEMTLRDIICHSIEEKLDEMGVGYEFPLASEVTNNKDSFVEMMEAFQKAYPDKGLLLVLDELLDYLRTRKEQQLILDLNFLREVGEICKSTRFRFMSGVQESLFDNAKFQFVAETLRRVKDRFEQVRIAREDVAFVVARRLLKKSPEQEGKIREHLAQYAPLYGSMNEKMDTFVELFPVHPAFLDTFEKVYVAEKREVLKTLSAAIRAVIDQDVPGDQPGLIAYDSYWTNLKDNPSFRSVPDIKEVIDKSKVLENRIQQAYTQPRYKSVALRIINALSVHRLTTGDIYNPMGATADELRDDLCLILPTPEKDADFLKTLVEKALQEIVKTVAGQFISYNKENGQYYLDLRKDVDFDSLIAKKADTLDADKLDHYYFVALTQVMEAADATFISGYKIWEHEVEWRERKAERSGYLFFGAPNDRSTAQPPRDFYLYFLQPNEPPSYKDEKRTDEVFFKLKHRDDAFDMHLKLFAGAREQATTASGENQRIYKDKAGGHLRELVKWLREHMTSAYEVTYEGRTRTLQEVIQGKVTGGVSRASVRDLVNTAGAACLSPQFASKSPDYPIFNVLITRRNREQAAAEALRWIAGGVKSKQGTAVLDALDLLDGDQLRPRQSRYASHVLDLLGAKKKGQVLNRSEMISSEDGIDYWERFRLEPEFLMVVVAALVQNASLVLSIPGQKFGPGTEEKLSRVNIGDLVNFKHVEKPKGLPLEALKELFTLLDIPTGQLVNEGTRDKAVNALQIKVASQVEKLVLAGAQLQKGLSIWGRAILSEQEAAEWSTKMSGSKEFLESLQAFNTVGKLNNFAHDVPTIQAQKAGLLLVKDVEELAELISQVGPQTAYLSIAEGVLPADHPWQAEVQAAKADLLTKVTSPKHRAESSFQRKLGQTLSDLKASYKAAYLALHKRAHLGAKDDSKKAALTKDRRLKQLQQLAKVEIMPGAQLKSFHDLLLGLKTCYALSASDLDDNPICQHTEPGYRPLESPQGAQSASDVLAGLDDRLDTLVTDWTTTLLSNLDDPTVAGNIELISDPDGKSQVAAFMKSRELPDPISDAFVQALRDALTGLEKVAVAPTSLRDALVSGGMPCTVDELKSRFDTYVAGLTKGKNASKVRVVVE